MELSSKLKSWILNNQEKIIEDSLDSLKIYSESYDRRKVAESLEQILNVAKKLGFKTELRANGEVGVVFFGEGEETLGVLTHVDVVPIGDINRWNYSPYGEIANENIYGRGIMDNKGMIISSLYAMAAVRALNLPIYKSLQLIIGTREEISWVDMELYFKEGHALPDYGFTPDGEFPIINREKGNCELLFHFRNENCLGDYEVIDFKSGEAVNSVPGMASIRLRRNLKILKEKVFNYNEKMGKELLTIGSIEPNEVWIKSNGKEAHSSTPELGENALTNLCVFLSELKINNKGLEKLIQFVKENFHENYFGDVLGLPKHPEYLNGEELGRTTLVPTLSYIEDGFQLYISIRPVYGTTIEEITNAFNLLKSKYDYEYKITDYLAPLYVPREHKFIEVLSKCYKTVTNKKSEFILSGGTSYAKALPNSVAFGPVFPEEEDVAHSVDEYYSIENLMKVTEIYALVIAEVLLNKESYK